jgi:hypothetical protein
LAIIFEPFDLGDLRRGGIEQLAALPEFQIDRSRDEISVRKFNFGVFTQPRPGADLSRHPFTGFELHHLKLLDRGEISCASIDLDTG